MTLFLVDQPSSLGVSLEWLTAVNRTKTSEYRRQLRDIPRAKFTCSFILDKDSFSPVWSSLNVGEQSVSIADFRYAQKASVSGSVISIDTDTYYGEIGDLIVFKSDIDEIFSIVSIGSGSATVNGTPTRQSGWFVPIQELELDIKPEFNAIGFNTVELLISGIANDYPDLSGEYSPEFLNSIAVRKSRTFVLGGAKYRINQNKELLTPESGPVISESMHDLTVGYTISFSKSLLGEIYEEETFFHYIAGQNVPFWVSSWLPDFVVQQDAPAGGAEVRIALPDDLEAYPSAVNIPSINQFTEVITTTVSGSELILNVSPPLAGDVFAGDTISRIVISRLSSDTVKFEMKDSYVVRDSLGVEETFV